MPRLRCLCLVVLIRGALPRRRPAGDAVLRLLTRRHRGAANWARANASQRQPTPANASQRQPAPSQPTPANAIQRQPTPTTATRREALSGRECHSLTTPVVRADIASLPTSMSTPADESVTAEEMEDSDGSMAGDVEEEEVEEPMPPPEGVTATQIFGAGREAVPPSSVAIFHPVRSALSTRRCFCAQGMRSSSSWSNCAFPGVSPTVSPSAVSPTCCLLPRVVRDQFHSVSAPPQLAEPPGPRLCRLTDVHFTDIAIKRIASVKRPAIRYEPRNFLPNRLVYRATHSSCCGSLGQRRRRLHHHVRHGQEVFGGERDRGPRRRCGTPQHGLYSKMMALITSGYGIIRSLIIKWP